MATPRRLVPQHRDPRCRPGQADALERAEGPAPACRPAAVRARARHGPASSRRTASASSTATAATRSRSAFPTPTSRGRCRTRRRAPATRWHRRCRISRADGVTLVLFGADPLAPRRDARGGPGPRAAGRAVAADDRARRSHRLRPDRPRRRRRRAGDRRAQGRDARAARHPRDQHRRDGGADRDASPAGSPRSTTAMRAASTTSPT